MGRILLVEDNELNRDMLSRRLRARGFEVELAFDGVDGIGKATSTLPDLVLMDMSLPRIDGWKATRLLKLNPATRSIPVVALTAHAMVTDRDKALDAGCDEYETKPVDMLRLLKKIDALLSRPRVAP